jgi:hypothetical protein
MSEARAVEAGDTLAPITNAETKEQKLARIAQILDRGIVVDRLHVNLPEGVHGEWVRDDPIAIERMKAIGFEVDTQFAKSRALHDDTGKVKVGDVIFMTAPQEIRDLVKQVRKRKFDDFYKKRPKVTKAEEVDQANFGAGVPELEVKNTSSVEKLDGDGLLSALKP